MVNEQELKGGHAPAEKVGGVRRRVRSKSDNVGGMAGAEPAPEESTPDVNPEQKSTEEGDGEETTEAVVESESGGVAPYKENTPEAVNSYHTKPLPSRDVQVSKNPQVTGQNMRINQPRK